MAEVSVGIITYQSARHIGRCLDAVYAQSLEPVELLVWDNASTDASVALARERGARVIASDRNLGFAAAANELIRQTEAPWFLLLNPDAYLAPDYLAELVLAAEIDPRLGSLTGKLLRPRVDDEPVRIDSTGHVVYRNRSVLNRGENEPDRGQFGTRGEVFGVCAAAALYRRAMLEDVRVASEYFGASFFTYLEDVDLDWRARLRGWKAYYVPSAVAVHERGHAGKRRTRNVAVLRHSLKNRYLMMLRNDTIGGVVRDLPAILMMEGLRVLDYAVTHPYALLGFADLAALLRPALVARREIQRRRTVPGVALRQWFQRYPLGPKLRALVLRDVA